ncbi:hypothetical protein ACOMHN_049229 [Nucella lapillus]
MPVVGFNSGKYDLNVIKPYFFARATRDRGDLFVVKNNNDFKCVSTRTLKFVDVTQYLAPRFSYSVYLATFGVEEKKGFFPYKFMD